MRVLVVEDERITRRVLQKCLEELGHDVTVAENGIDGWEAWQSGHFPLVISDWMMPGLSGPEFVQRIRAADKTGYCYVIMLTARSQKRDIVTGMEAGADDFLGKPFDRNELRVRIRAGERIIALERDLAQRNELLERANDRMSRDLAAAARVQQSLLPNNVPESDAAHFAWSYRPCDELAGDTLNVFQLDDDHVGLYLADVSGHGVAASLLSVTISRVITPAPWKSSLLSTTTTAGTVVATPSEVAAELNNRFPMEEHYFTIVYCVLNTKTRELSFTAAGHPPIIRLCSDGGVERLASNNLAIGWAPDEPFSQGTTQLAAGDRLFLYSDGIPEAASPGGNIYGRDRLTEFLTGAANDTLEECLTALVSDVENWSGSTGPDDDLSILGFEIC